MQQFDWCKLWYSLRFSLILVVLRILQLPVSIEAILHLQKTLM